MHRIMILTIAFVTILGLSASATIINIPDDYGTIQEGIGGAAEGDTVLVQPGTYIENLNFNGRNIVLGSLFLTTGDTSFISQTIIDGDSSNSVITFDQGENDNAMVIGFVIRNGCASDGGGGIHCTYGSSPRIYHNIIENNTTYCGYESEGGGILCLGSEGYFCNNIIRDNYASDGGGIYSRSEAVFSENIIYDNQAAWFGGGVYFSTLDKSDFKRNIIYGNSANYGGGIYAHTCTTVIRQNTIYDNNAGSGGGAYLHQAAPVLVNNTFTINYGNYGGGLYSWISSPLIINCIFFGDSAQSYPEFFLSGGNPSITYSDIQGGYTGEGNIDQDPLFRDPQNLNFHLQTTECGDSSNSPCIDAGYPAVLDSVLDCDWGLGDSISDMGTYAGGDTIPYYGRIFHVPSEYSTIQEAIAATYRGDTVLVQPGIYNEHITFMNRAIIVASMYLLTEDTSYISSTVIDGDSSWEVIRFENDEDSTSVIIGFTIQNGDVGIRCLPETGPGIFQNIIRGNNHDGLGGGIICGDESCPTIRANLITENTAGSGAGIYCRESNAVISGNIISNNLATFQSGEGGGILSEHNDNALICNNSFITNSAPDGGGAISCAFSSNPRIYNNIFYRNTTVFAGGAVYLIGSAARLNNNIFIQNSAQFGGAIVIFDESCCNFTNNVTWRNSAYSGGAVYSADSNPIFTNCIFWNDSATFGDEIRVYSYNNQLEPVFSYCDVQGGWEGENNINIDPNFRAPDEGDFHLLDSLGCGDLYYSPCIDAGHPGLGDSLLDCGWGLGGQRSDIGAFGGGDGFVDIRDRDIDLPDRASLSQNYPNPFNSSTTIDYILPYQSDVEIEIYDILGRKAATLVRERQHAGQHSVVWNVDDRPSGVYFYRLRADHYSETRKMLLLK